MQESGQQVHHSPRLLQMNGSFKLQLVMAQPLTLPTMVLKLPTPHASSPTAW